MPASLKEEIACVRKYLTSPPANESNTCDWVILPLLWAAGYERHDIHSRSRDSAGNFPDYTMLPNTPHTWFLEAKAWGAVLKDEYAIQAVNYANSQGKRWVVLCDGRIWRLYDNCLTGVPPEGRMVAETRLDDGEFEVFMTAIGKDSVVAEKLEGFVQRRRLHAILGQELIEQDSKLIRAIRNSLRSDYALPGVPGSEVASYFAAWKAVPPAGPVPAAALAPLSVAANGNADDDGADDAAKAGDFDTIVVPAQEEGFQDTFLGENRWYQIRIRRECIPFIKFIAVYRKAPVSAITHLAPVKSIVPWPGSAKYVVNFAEPAKEIPPIPAVRGGKVMAPQAPRYALRARLFEAKSLDELWEP